MNGLRFKVGEMAIIAVIRNPAFQHMLGELVTIRKVGSLTIYGGLDDYQLDYLVGKYHACVADWQLRKIDPPAEPASLTRDNGCEVSA